MSRNFTKFAAALLLVLGMVGTSRAQDNGTMTNDPNIIRPITREGSAAFLFTIQGLGTFGLGAPTIGSGDAAMAGAGMKWYFSDNLALRLLIALNNTSNKTTTGSTSTTVTSTGFGLGAGVEYHFRPLYSTSPYIGGQLGFASNSQDAGTAGKTALTSFGLNVFAGFDWFWTRGIAAGAEYGLGFASGSGTFTPSGGSSSDLPSSTTIGINGAGNVHLVVYF